MVGGKVRVPIAYLDVVSGSSLSIASESSSLSLRRRMCAHQNRYPTKSTLFYSLSQIIVFFLRKSYRTFHCRRIVYIVSLNICSHYNGVCWRGFYGFFDLRYIRACFSQFLYAHNHRFTIVTAQFFHATASFQSNVSKAKLLVVNPGYVGAILLFFGYKSLFFQI